MKDHVKTLDSNNKNSVPVTKLHFRKVALRNKKGQLKNVC